MTVAFSLLVTNVTQLLRQVAGQSVQTYSEGLIQKFVNDAFDFCHKKHFWHQYSRWTDPAVTLDGTTGVITTDLIANSNEIIEWNDIEAVWPAIELTERRRIPRLPRNRNPLSLPASTYPSFVEPLGSAHARFASRVFQIWPKSATGDLVVHYRFKPKALFIEDDAIYLDRIMLEYAATYLYLKDDGAVPDMVDEYKNLFDVRFRDILKADDNLPIEVKGVDSYPMTGGIPSEWWSR